MFIKLNIFYPIRLYQLYFRYLKQIEIHNANPDYINMIYKQ